MSRRSAPSTTLSPCHRARAAYHYCRVTTALAQLPRLGVGISAEPGSAAAGIDALAFADDHPGLVHFLEYGSDLDRGLDDHVRRWAAAGRADDLPLPRSQPRRSRRRRRRLAARHRRRRARHRRRLAVRRRRAVALRRARSRPPDAAAADPDARLRRRLRRVDRAHRGGDADCAFCRRTRRAPSTSASCTSSTTSRASATAPAAACCSTARTWRCSSGCAACRRPPRSTASRSIASSRSTSPAARPSTSRGWRSSTTPTAPSRCPTPGRSSKRCCRARPSLRAIVYECEKNAPDEVVDNFRRLNRMFPLVKAASARRSRRSSACCSTASSRRACAATPAAALPELPAPLRTQLAAIDPRALKLDRLLRRRTLRTLFDEYKASTTLYPGARASKLSALDEFFRSRPFHDAIASARPLALPTPIFSAARRRPSSARSPKRAA